MVTATEKLQQMTGWAALPRDFVRDAMLAAQYWLEDGDTPEGIEEWKAWVRANWSDEEFRAQETQRVKEIANFMRELQSMARGVTERIKAQLSADAMELGAQA